MHNHMHNHNHELMFTISLELSVTQLRKTNTTKPKTHRFKSMYKGSETLMSYYKQPPPPSTSALSPFQNGYSWPERKKEKKKKKKKKKSPCRRLLQPMSSRQHSASPLRPLSAWPTAMTEWPPLAVPRPHRRQRSRHDSVRQSL